MTDDQDVGGIVAAPLECSGCGSTVYVGLERLESDEPLTCNEHT